jgi:acetylornithine deacetylase
VLSGQRAGTVAFGTEGPYLQALGMETVVLGPGHIDQAHQPDEFLRVDRIAPTVELLRGLIVERCSRR